MKISVSISADSLRVLDTLVAARGLPSRSAAVAWAIRAAEWRDLPSEYASAWQEWDEAGEEGAWSLASSDGLADAAR